MNKPFSKPVWPGTRLAWLFLAAAGFGSTPLPAANPDLVKDAGERLRIEQAVPARAPAKPAKPRKLLIFDLNVNYGGHPSSQHANYAFTLMGEKTGAFETRITRDPGVFKPESLREFDAVFFNNNVGNLFTDPALRQSLVDFIYAGGGLMGVHGTAVAFTQWPGAVEDWPEFGLMIGGRGANHRDSTELVWARLDEPEHPLTRVFGGRGFEYRDEFFRVHEPYSRQRVRVLFSIDTAKSDQKGQARGNCYREDDDYALAWIRNYGRGRAFYCTIAHNPYVFWDARMLEFYLGAIQFILGDLPAPATPSQKLTPAVRAQEKLGWRLGLAPAAETLFEALERAAGLGLSHMAASTTQNVSREIPKKLGPGLSEDELRQIRFKLDATGVRLLSLRLSPPPAGEAAWRTALEFARKLGVETLLAPAPVDFLERLDSLCQACQVNVALTPPGPGAVASPENLCQNLQGRSRCLGVAADVGVWLRAGIDPVAAIGCLGGRLQMLSLNDWQAKTPGSGEAPWGGGVAGLDAALKEIHRLGLKPQLVMRPPPETARSLQWFDNQCLQLAK